MSYLPCILVVFGAVWTIFKSITLKYYKRDQDLSRLFDALEVGVHTAWEQIVKPYLTANGAEAKLPADIREAAKSTAISTAVNVDKIVQKFPAEVVSAALKQTVEEQKRLGGK